MVLEVVDFELMVAFYFVEYFESDCVLIDEGCYFVLEFIVFFFVVLEFFF